MGGCIRRFEGEINGGVFCDRVFCWVCRLNDKGCNQDEARCDRFPRSYIVNG